MSEAVPTDEELSDFRATCRAFLDEHATGISLSEPDPRDHATMAQNKAFQGLLADAGLAGITYPKEYGGAGLTKAHEAIWREEYSKYPEMTTQLTISHGMCLPMLSEYGTDEQKEVYVADNIAARTVWCQMFSEPGAGSDVASLQTRADLDKVDSADIPEVKRVVASNGACLRDPDSQRLYCIECSKFVPLSLGTLLEIVVGQDDSEEGFISRITQALAEEIYFVGIEGINSTECIVKGWSKKTKTPVAWRVSRVNELLGKLESELGPAADWLKANVGIPRSLSTKVVSKRVVPLNLIDLNSKMEKYLRYAVGRVVRRLPSTSSLEELKSGSHYISVSFEEGVEEKCWAVVNGSDVYFLSFS